MARQPHYLTLATEVNGIGSIFSRRFGCAQKNDCTFAYCQPFHKERLSQLVKIRRDHDRTPMPLLLRHGRVEELLNARERLKDRSVHRCAGTVGADLDGDVEVDAFE